MQELGASVDQLSSSVAAASTYVGSLWGGWNTTSKQDQEKHENTEAVEAKDSKKGSMSGGLGMMSSAFGKLSSFWDICEVCLL